MTFALPPDLDQQCSEVFLQCAEFESLRSLEAVFTTTTLAPFARRLPLASGSKMDFVADVKRYLLLERLVDGRPLLLPFLEALRRRYPQEDALYGELEDLRRQVEALQQQTQEQPRPAGAQPRPAPPPAPSYDRAALRQKLATHFSLDDLELLCFDLGIQYENFTRRLGKMAQELVVYCEQTGRIEDLIAKCQKERPQIDWLERLPPAQPDQESSTNRQGLTVVSRETISAELTLEIAPGVPITFVRVPAGEFYMGSDKERDPDADDDEQPLHLVHLDEYWIGKYPITNPQYQAYVQDAKRKSPDHWSGDSIPKGILQHPVVNVSWDDAQDFCQWLLDKAKAHGLRVRLPTEAEWEKAARGGLQIPRLRDGHITGLIDNPFPQRIYPWGNDKPSHKYCNFNLNVNNPTPVGRYSPLGDSPYGCADMVGNVWEWTSSLWGKDPSKPDYGYPYDPHDWRRKDPASRDRRVLRGGSFRSEPRFVRCSLRYGYMQDVLDDDGFRVVCCSTAGR
jgi:formylglycine-generating enzyme required for sulfatase activity